MMGNSGGLFCAWRERRDWRVLGWWMGMFGRKLSQVGGGGGILRCSTSERVQCTMEKFKTCKKAMIKLFIFSIAFIKLHAFSWICLKYYDEK